VVLPTSDGSADAGGPAPNATAPTIPTFEEIYARRFHDVLRWIRALGGLNTDLEDLAQEVFLVVQRRLIDFDGRNLGAWLYKIAKNQVSDHRRRAWVRRLFLDSKSGADVADNQVHIQSIPNPHEVLEQREIRKFLAQVLNKMSVAQRSAFVLFEIEGYSGEEVAELEGIPLNTVWTRLHHARKTFFKLIDQARAEGRLP
jgi:RNA polymerase sigma-70 factor (ECF subfamily)